MRQPTALLSVYNKDGIVEFARNLIELGFRIISSGGTASKLKEADVPVTDVAEISGLPPILGHRVVTLVPQIHGGLLAMETQFDELEELGYPKIDLVCVDLYPLQEEINKPDATRESVIEKTDIGGPTMLRSGAKGRRIVICDPHDRMPTIAWLREGKPNEDAYITALVAKTEKVMADYSLASATYHSNGNIRGMIGTKVRDLRYGENPYQKATLYKTNNNPMGVPAFKQIAGADPSMINMTDIDRLAQTLVQIAATFEINFGSPPCIAIAAKHGNACGAGVGMHPEIAIRKMIEGDPLAIFGASVMTNFPIDAELATILRTHKMPDGTKRLFDGIAAPSFAEDANEVLERKHGKCRLYSNLELSNVSKAHLPSTRIRRVGGGEIWQTGPSYVLDLNSHHMEKLGPDLSIDDRRSLALAFAVGSTSTSNTITLAKNEMIIGNACGQQARVRAARLALMIAEEGAHDVKGAVAYSDSYFPEPDGPTVLIEAGVHAIFASSGSLKDKIVREACQSRGISFWQLPDAECRGFSQH